MDINIVVPPLARTRFSGGIWCILQHAQELGRRGHRVNVVPTHPCPPPEWFPQPWTFAMRNTAPTQALRHGGAALLRAMRAAMAYRLQAQGKAAPALEGAVREQLGLFGLSFARYGSYGTRQGGGVEHLARVLPEGDITVATDAETAWPVRLLGKGRLAYFAQHYEAYFWKERLGGEASLREAEVSYRLGLHQIVNSPWLQAQLQQLQPALPVQLCPNAIDHRVFDGAPTPRLPGAPLKIISYGGRNAEWKGFRELCEALRLVRTRHPGLAFEWSVYGEALLPPDNSVCAYKPLGFLAPAALAAAYRDHHVMLSASWYESFPLFPLEAMACGIAAITTQPGTELFAQHDETALVVQARDPESIAAAVVRLAGDEDLRQRLCRQGQLRSRAFDWQHAGDAMEAALTAICAAADGAGPPPTPR